MDFKVSDLLRIPFLKNAEIVAGRSGIGRNLNRYFELHPDSFREESLLNMHENDILILAEDLRMWTQEQLEKTVQDALRHKAGCLVMFSSDDEYSLSGFCIEEAEKGSIPLVIVTERRLPAGILSREIMLHLLQFYRDSDYLKELFLYLTGEKELSPSDLQVIRQCSGYDFSVPHQAVCILPKRRDGGPENEKPDTGELRNIRESVLQWTSENAGKVLEGIRQHRIFFFLPHSSVCPDAEQRISSLLQELQKTWTGFSFSAGIGSMKEGLESWKESLKEAGLVSRAMRIFEWQGVRTIWSAQPAVLLLDIRDQGQLFRLRDPIVQPLYSFSRTDSADRELAYTLEMYFRYGRNASLTAEKMYIHRNTLALRLKKIEKICGFDLSDPLLCRRLEFALYVEKCLLFG